MTFWQRTFWHNTLFDWTVALSELLLLFTVLELLRFVLIKKLRKLAARTKTHLDDLLVLELEKTHHLPLLLVSLHFAALSLSLPRRLAGAVLTLTVLVLLLQAGIWATTAIRFWLGHYRQEKAQEDAAAATTMGALAFAARVVVWVIVTLLALDNLGVNVTGLIAGLGIGGIAVALAAQNILSDLFASLSIVLDKPFVIGDSIAFDSQQGTVERIGLKTTRLRSLSGEELVVANSDLLHCRIANFRRMRERRAVMVFGFPLDTPTERLEILPAALAQCFTEIAGARFERAHFRGIGPATLEFELVYWVTSPDYGHYMDVQQRVNLAVLRTVRAQGLEIAPPARAVHLVGPTPQ